MTDTLTENGSIFTTSTSAVSDNAQRVSTYKKAQLTQGLARDSVAT